MIYKSNKDFAVGLSTGHIFEAHRFANTFYGPYFLVIPASPAAPQPPGERRTQSSIEQGQDKRAIEAAQNQPPRYLEMLCCLSSQV